MSPPAPLFILTCMRSYSSLVSSMLGQHSGLYCLPEVNPFIAGTLGESVTLLELVRKRTLDGLYRAVAQIEFGSQTEAAVRKARAWVAERRGWTANDLMAHLGERVAPRRLIEKSPSTVLTPERIEAAMRLFPEARFLHLYRHPVATTSSIAKITGAGASGGGRGRDPEEAWYGTNAAIIAAGGRLPEGSFMSVRGEDVLTNPDSFLTQICAWLGLETTGEDLAAMRRPEESPFAMLGPPSAPFGNDPNFLRNPAYVRREIHQKPLASILDWAPGQRRLKPQTIALSQLMGYHDDA